MSHLFTCLPALLLALVWVAPAVAQDLKPYTPPGAPPAQTLREPQIEPRDDTSSKMPMPPAPAAAENQAANPEPRTTAREEATPPAGHEMKDQTQLIQQLPMARVPLAQGLVASQREGTPISAKYEVEDGKLQLSVYTANGSGLSEVIVDHQSGQITEAKPITGGDDLTAAQSQREIMRKARKSLDAAVAEALQANRGYQAVSVFPMVKQGRPVAEITLMKGNEEKKVEAPLT